MNTEAMKNNEIDKIAIYRADPKENNPINNMFEYDAYDIYYGNCNKLKTELEPIHVIEWKG